VTYRFIDAEKTQYRVARLCRVLRISRSGYYAWQRRGASERSAQDVVLAAKITAIHSHSDGSYGVPRVHAELRAQGIRISRRRVARLMRELGLEGVSRRKRRSTTTGGERPAAPDLIERRFFDHATGPDQVWYADITYVPTWQGWLYVALVVDAWSRRIVGWSMRDTLEAVLVVDALGMATRRRSPAAGAIHHSDRGSQYGAAVYGRTLRESGLVQSMGRCGSALDNAACESVMATFKTELVHRRSFQTRDQAREQVFRWIEGWYNARRRHSSLGYLSPTDYEAIHAESDHPAHRAETRSAHQPSQPLAEGGEGHTLTQNGRTAPVDPDQPALHKGALIGLEHPSTQTGNVSTEPR
jgi:putative transposase